MLLLVLQVVTYITNGNVTHVGTAKKIQVGGPNVLALLTLFVSLIGGLDIKVLQYKNTHAMAMVSSLQ